MQKKRKERGQYSSNRYKPWRHYKLLPFTSFNSSSPCLASFYFLSLQTLLYLSLSLMLSGYGVYSSAVLGIRTNKWRGKEKKKEKRRGEWPLWVVLRFRFLLLSFFLSANRKRGFTTSQPYRNNYTLAYSQYDTQRDEDCGKVKKKWRERELAAVLVWQPPSARHSFAHLLSFAYFSLFFL